MIRTGIAEHIKGEHLEFEKLLENLLKIQDESRIPMFKQALKRLDAHAKAEEQTIFKILSNEETTRDIGLELLEWHLLIRHAMREIVTLDNDDELWNPKMRIVKSVFTDHFEVEEILALPLIERLCGQERLEQIEQDFRSIEGNLLK